VSGFTPSIHLCLSNCKDSQRLDMSLATVRSAGRDHRGLSQILVDLDTESMQSDHLESFERGPFRVFRSRNLKPVCQQIWSGYPQEPPAVSTTLAVAISDIADQELPFGEIDADFPWNLSPAKNNPFLRLDASPYPNEVFVSLANIICMRSANTATSFKTQYLISSGHRVQYNFH
jgi:hypothetical protein